MSKTGTTVQTTVTFTDDRLTDLLTCALEGGSNYWYTIAKSHHGEPHPDEKYREEWKGFLHSCPFEEGGWLDFETTEEEQPESGVLTGKKYRLNRKAIEKGLQLMATKAPRHFADVLNDNDDAITGDVFLQLCLFGEVIYG